MAHFSADFPVRTSRIVKYGSFAGFKSTSELHSCRQIPREVDRV